MTAPAKLLARIERLERDIKARAEALIPNLAGVNVGMFNEIRAGA